MCAVCILLRLGTLHCVRALNLVCHYLSLHVTNTYMPRVELLIIHLPVIRNMKHFSH